MHLVLFDIDGTLISSGGAGRTALEAALADEFGVPLRGQLELSGRTDRAIVEDLLRLAGLPVSEENLQRIQQGYLRHLPEHLRRHSALDPAHPRFARILPGVEALVQGLHQREGFLLGLLTGNIRDGARIKLGHFRLFDYFPIGGFGDRHHDRDDVAREALAEAHRHLGYTLSPERVWVIGDTPLDIRCARAIGARAVAVVTGWHDREELAGHRPDFLLDDLSDPREVLAAWEVRVP
jgi:phosphoglycolate phosphatase-like HAD superfamily hydrolase